MTREAPTACGEEGGSGGEAEKKEGKEKVRRADGSREAGRQKEAKGPRGRKEKIACLH